MMIAFVIAGTFTNLSLSAFAVAVSSAILAMLGARKQTRHADPVEELTARVREQSRHPLRYAVTHPVDTLKRLTRSRT